MILPDYILSKALALQVRAALAARPQPGAFLFGPAGSGKSALPQALARSMGRPVIFYQAFPGTREDDLIFKLIPDESSPSGIRLSDGPLAEAAKASIEGPVFLVLDEWDKARPSADSILLDFLQSGRINYCGVRLQACQENLACWITLNDERELSEPLLRRLPLIEFSLPDPSLVRDALELTHPGHPYINAAVALYRRGLSIADLPKPITIQELRQLLDGIDTLGSDADWDLLVRLFISKSDEMHRMIKASEIHPIDPQPAQSDRARLDPSAYSLPEDEGDASSEEAEESKLPPLPKLREVKRLKVMPEFNEIPMEYLKGFSGIFQWSEEAYDILAAIAESPPRGKKPEYIPGVARVFSRGDEWYIGNLRKWEIGDAANFPLWYREGEQMFSSPISGGWERAQKALSLLRDKGCRITRYSADEITGISEDRSIEFRITKHRIEIITQCGGRNIGELKELLRGIGAILSSKEPDKPHARPKSSASFPGWGKRVSYQLEEGLEAQFRIDKSRMEAPEYGDGLYARLHIWLPGGGTEIDKRIQFGIRMKILGFPLYDSWGKPAEGGGRVRTDEIRGGSWDEAGEKAHEQALKELGRLREFLQRRKELFDA